MKSNSRLMCLFLVAFALLGTHSFSQNLSKDELVFEPLLFRSSKGVEVQAERGRYLVPENRKKPGSRKIEIYFLRFKSISDHPGYPIVYLAGGPGGSGIAAARGDRFELFMALREFGDVIALDQRGTGLSNHLEPCNPSLKSDVETPGDFDKMISLIKQNTISCMEYWKSKGIDIDGYNNLENAADIDDLRRSLKANKITLWGISYGTQLAFSYIRQYGKNVDRMILAALEATGDNIKQPKHVDHFLISAEKVLSENTGNGPSLMTLMKSVLDQLDKHPVITSFKDKMGVEIKVGISKLDVQLLTSFLWTKNPSDLKMLLSQYQKMSKNDYQETAKMLYRIKSYISSPDFYGMGLLMDAATGINKTQMHIIEKQSQKSLLGRTTNFPFPDLSYGLGLTDLGTRYRKDVKSNVPGLFLSGTLDGRTFIEDATRISKKFKNVKHVILENAGHDMFEQSPKVQELIIHYLRGETISDTIHLPALHFESK
jgi:pimeloyl-ACP methyl ester carboxylesterase